MTYRNLKIKTNLNSLIPRPSKFIKKFLSIFDFYTNWYKKIDCNII